MAEMGQEERFPPTRLSAGYGFRKETIAGVRHNGRDAPIPDLPASASERGTLTARKQIIRDVPKAELQSVA
jgi:hypothetical protein